MRGLKSGRCLKFGGEPRPAVASSIKYAGNALALVRAQRQVYVELFVFSLTHSRSARVHCDYRRKNGVSLLTLSHPSAFNFKKPLFQPVSIYGKANHCHFDEAKANSGWSVINGFSFCVLFRIRLIMCTADSLQIYQNAVCLMSS